MIDSIEPPDFECDHVCGHGMANVHYKYGGVMNAVNNRETHTSDNRESNTQFFRKPPQCNSSLSSWLYWSYRSNVRNQFLQGRLTKLLIKFWPVLMISSVHL
ncbi:hypothetical protein MS3_00001209 [Schistosoma haematobium]|uniref:Uncharacterized protein n=1 Tax=Schistosoma haematobium TaxID=6185 RepID=A0A922S3H4_SCHHA|nr:hypothetical protein MS3_00001209 [Schistosoma haematobium]KAH9591770.1 hypothetical protein MS3_00001209 [Schistosoma haematobium]